MPSAAVIGTAPSPQLFAKAPISKQSAYEQLHQEIVEGKLTDTQVTAKIKSIEAGKAKGGESFPGESFFKSVGEDPLGTLLSPGKLLGGASEAAHNTLGIPTVGEFGEKRPRAW